MKPSQIIRLDSRTKKKEIELDLEGQTELSARGRANLWRNRQNCRTHLVSGNIAEVWSPIVP